MIDAAGRELDALVCAEVFGLVPCQGAKHDADYPNTYCFAQPESPAQGGEARNYATGMEAAWEVVEQLRPRFEVTLIGAPDGLWSCEFKEPHPRRRHYRYHYVAAETASLAICRAALLAVRASQVPVEPA